MCYEVSELVSPFSILSAPLTSCQRRGKRPGRPVIDPQKPNRAMTTRYTLARPWLQPGERPTHTHTHRPKKKENPHKPSKPSARCRTCVPYRRNVLWNAHSSATPITNNKSDGFFSFGFFILFFRFYVPFFSTCRSLPRCPLMAWFRPVAPPSSVAELCHPEQRRIHRVKRGKKNPPTNEWNQDRSTVQKCGVIEINRKRPQRSEVDNYTN